MHEVERSESSDGDARVTQRDFEGEVIGQAGFTDRDADFMVLGRHEHADDFCLCGNGKRFGECCGVEALKKAAS